MSGLPNELLYLISAMSTRGRWFGAQAGVPAAFAAIVVGTAHRATPPRPAPTCAFVVTVADAATNAPLPDADVSVAEPERSARTSWIGEAILADLPDGRHHVSVRHGGYTPAELDASCDRDSVGIFFRLAAQPHDQGKTARLVPRALGGPPTEFESHRRLRLGHFLGDSVFRRDSARALTDILDRWIPALHVDGTGGGVVQRACEEPVDVYVNGVRLPASPGAARQQPDLRLIRGADVVGLEYYTAAEEPAEYRGQRAGCGVLLIWLR